MTWPITIDLDVSPPPQPCFTLWRTQEGSLWVGEPSHSHSECFLKDRTPNRLQLRPPLTVACSTMPGWVILKFLKFVCRLAE